LIRFKTSVFFKIWFFLFFCGMGFLIPQISAYFYNELKIESPGTIFLTGQLLMPVGALLSGYISDKTLHARNIIFIKSILAAISIYFLAAISQGKYKEYIFEYALFFWPAVTFAVGGIIPLIDVFFLQSDNDPVYFGHSRLYGTAGFLSANIPFLFLKIDPSEIMKFSFVFILASSFLLYFFPEKRKPRQSEKASVHLDQFYKIIKSKLMLFFLIMMFFFFFGYSTAEYIISAYLADVDFIVSPIPFIWIIGTSVEIIFFMVSPLIIKKKGIMAILGFGLIAGAVRNFILWALSPGFLVLISQFLHGVQFSGGYMGSLLFLEKKTHPRRLATAQAIYLIFSRSLGAGAGAYFLGNLASEKEFKSVFLIAAIFSFISFLIFWFFRFYQRKYKNFVERQ